MIPPNPDASTERDFQVSLLLIVNVPISADNPDFTAEDAKDAAWVTATEALTAAMNCDVNFVTASAEED